MSFLHGTDNGYTSHGCRCVACTKDHAEKFKHYSRKLVEQKNHPHEHQWRSNGGEDATAREICKICRTTRNKGGVYKPASVKLIHNHKSAGGNDKLNRLISVYVLKDPRNDQIRYVGVSGKPILRLSSHISEARKGKRTHKAMWIRILLCAGLSPDLEVIEETRDPNEREIYWIKKLKEQGCDLTNGTEGGSGIFTEETKKKLRDYWTPERRAEKSAMAKKNKNYKFLDQGRKKLTAESFRKSGESRKGTKRTTEQKERMSAGHKASTYKFTDERRKNQSDSRKGKKLSPEHRANMRAAAARNRKEKALKLQAMEDYICRLLDSGKHYG